MALEIKKVEYFDTIIEGHVGDGSIMLSVFADVGISWLAFKAVPYEHSHIRFSLFPDDREKMVDQASKSGVELDGPHSAILIKGGDEPGALADIYKKLTLADIHVNEASGIADINGGYGVILYFSNEDCEKALAVLER
jgi:hypothetical protein